MGIRLPFLQSAIFYVIEEERLVLISVEFPRNKDGAADVSSKKVVVQLGARTMVPLGKVIVGIEVGVSQELPQRSMDLIRSRLDTRVQNAPAGPPELGAERAGLYLEFLDGVYGRQDRVRCAGPVIRLQIVIVHAIE